MKKQLLFLLTTILSLNCYSQITFEKGYYINNTNQKINCLIKNIDWKNNPTEFEYKLSENAAQNKATIKLVKEFGVYNYSKYIRSTVNIDRSSKNIDNLSTNRNPIFKKEELFLKILVEGQSNLYQYEDRNLVRFFYSKNNSNNIEQLIFKNYKSSGDLIRENNGFKQQLLNELKCQHIKVKDIKKISYEKNDLVNLFIEFNQCNNSEIVNFDEKQKKDLFNLTPRLGLNSSSLSIQNSVSSFRETDFDNELTFRFGIEAEFIMPFNKNKWSLIIEPSYQYFKSEKETANLSAKADYKSIEIPIGIRHYFFLNEKSKIFINASFIIDLSNNSIIDFNSRSELEIETGNNLAFGIGYKYNKYSIEFRYQTNRNILRSYAFWSSDYKTFSVIFGFSIF